VNFKQEKFRQLVQYICWKSDDPTQLGSTKLNKVLWHSDTVAYRLFGEPMAGATYIKRQFGPVPQQILPALEWLRTSGKLAIRSVEHFGYPKKEFFALQPPDLADFTGPEISLVDQAIEYVCAEHTAKSISLETHDDIWKMAAIGEEIPYFTIFASRLGEITENDIEWAKIQAEDIRANA
jgi:hypothetical protein